MILNFILKNPVCVIVIILYTLLIYTNLNCEFVIKVILDRFPVIEIQMYKLSSFDDEYIFCMYILGFLQVLLLVPLCVMC